MRELLLILSVVITLGATYPYLRDIVRGETRPNIVSWITWTLITLVATVAEVAAGEHMTAIFTSAAVLATGLVVVFGLKYGYVKYTAFDVACQVGALLGFVLWYVFNSPTAAVIAAVTIDFIGALPTVRHSWQKPHEETWITFALGGIAATLALVAITSYNWASLSYPIYIAAMNFVLAGIILYRSRHNSN